MPRSNRSSPARHARDSHGDVAIPDKLYFRIGEVSRLTQTKPFVLRYWETEFPMLRPDKARSGHRLYRRKDVETVLEIKRLLYEQGFTIAGARKQLAGDSKASTDSKAALASPSFAGPLKALKRELESVLTILSRRC